MQVFLLIFIFSGSGKTYQDTNKEYINAMAATVMSSKVIRPSMFESFELVFSFIIFLLLPICITIAIIMGAVSPYDIAVYSNAFIGLMFKKSRDRPTNKEKIMEI